MFDEKPFLRYKHGKNPFLKVKNRLAECDKYVS